MSIRRPAAARLLRSWLGSHAQSAVSALGAVVRQPGASLLTVIVIAVALALPAGLQLLVNNGRSLGSRWQSATDFTVYLDTSLAEEQGRAVATRIAKLPGVAHTRFISASEGMSEFRRASGFGDALDALETNPLPGAVVVRPQGETGTGDALQSLAARIRDMDGVDLVQVDTRWVRRFQAMLDIARRIAAVSAVLLGAAVAVVIMNTIRLDIQGRRNEIEVMKLIGASDRFIRRPFLYTGLWFGAAGGFMAWIVVVASLTLLATPVARLAGLYGSEFVLRGLGLAQGSLLVATGGALGWLGSWLATARHLRAIEPQ